MPEEKKRVLLIGENPDIELFVIRGEEGCEIAALESPLRARVVYPSYKPHFIFVHLRYSKDITILEECLAMAGSAPVVAAISILAKMALVKVVKAKADSFVVLPVNRQVLRKVSRQLGPSEDKEEFPLAEKNNLPTA
jgi:hypothetical protein